MGCAITDLVVKTDSFENLVDVADYMREQIPRNSERVFQRMNP